MGGILDGNERESCYEVYYIKEEALKLLLAGLGQKEWFGVFGEPVCHQKMRADFGMENGMLADMYQNGMIDWEGTGLSVRQPYAGMLSAMLEEKICVTVQLSGVSVPLRCCYISSKGVVMTQKSQREDDTLGIAYLSVSDWLQMLTEACVRLEDGECCLLSQCDSRNGRVFQNIRLQRDGLRTIRMEWDADGGGRLRCGYGQLEAKLKERFAMVAVHMAAQKEGAGDDTD